VPEEFPLRPEPPPEGNPTPPTRKRSPKLFTGADPEDHNSCEPAPFGVGKDGFIYRDARRCDNLVLGFDSLLKSPPAIGQGSLAIGRT